MDVYASMIISGLHPFEQEREQQYIYISNVVIL